MTPLTVTIVDRPYKAGRHILNVQELQNKIKAKWADSVVRVVHVEGMDLRQQIALFQHTSILIWTHGAAMADLLFLPQVANLALMQISKQKFQLKSVCKSVLQTTFDEQKCCAEIEQYHQQFFKKCKELFGVVLVLVKILELPQNIVSNISSSETYKAMPTCREQEQWSSYLGLMLIRHMNGLKAFSQTSAFPYK